MKENDNSELTQTDEASSIIDPQKRKWLAGLGLTSLLSACAEPASTYRRHPEQDSNVDPSCGCMTGGPPPGAGTPPAGGGTGTPGAGGGAATPNPTPGAGTANPTPTGAQTFVPLMGPSVGVTVDMQSIAIAGRATPLPVWSFVNTATQLGFNEDRLLPSPVIETVVGQPTSISLTSAMAHSLHLHGLDVDTANDGVPLTSGYVGMSMMGFGRVAGYTALPSPFTYQFTPQHAGTYLYHCHVDTVLHMEMGMSGVIIVRPSDGSQNTLEVGGTPFDKEYIWQLQPFASSWHGSPMAISGANTVRYQPDLFLINGKAGADLLSDPSVAISATAGQRVLVRLVNPGYLPAVVNLGGIRMDVVASDGRMITPPIQGTEVTVGPGERYDVWFIMPQTTTPLPARARFLTVLGGTAGVAESQISSV